MAKSLEQFAAKELELEIRSIPLDLIDFNEENPNEIDPATYEALKADIRDFGFWQPVLVTIAENGRWKMVDGEHRARIVKDLGGQSIPAVVGDTWDLDEQRFRLLTMNRFKGEFKPLPLSSMLVRLNESHTQAQIRQRLGMDEAELRGRLELARFPDSLKRLQDQVERERVAAPVVLQFPVGQRDGELIERVVTAAASGKLDRGKALAAVCREWERAHKSKAKEKASE